MNDYQTFLQSKRLTTAPAGFTVALGAINPMLFPYQRAIVRWAAQRGRAAIFADTGLGKTLMQVEWARLVAAETSGRVLLLSPLAVAHQTIREAAKLGVGVTYVRSQAEADAAPTRIVITNYDMVKALDAPHSPASCSTRAAFSRRSRVRPKSCCWPCLRTRITAWPAARRRHRTTIWSWGIMPSSWV